MRFSGFGAFYFYKVLFNNVGLFRLSISPLSVSVFCAFQGISPFHLSIHVNGHIVGHNIPLLHF